MSHIPVLLHEAIEILNPRPGEFFIDGTIGSGGHSSEILKRIGPKGKLLGIDWDGKMIERLKIEKLKDYKNAILINDNYANLPEILEKNNLPKGSSRTKSSLPHKADGLILDLGFSSEQLDPPAGGGRGFSFLRNEILDMRYDSENENPTAAEVVNSSGEKDLADIFYKYGEERFSRRIAKKIIEERKKKSIKTTFDLVEVIKKSVPKSYERGRIHPATRVFQALRIYVNDELGNLENVLKNIGKIVKNKGRIAIISYHSLEDRLIKNYFRQMAKEGRADFVLPKADFVLPKAEILTKKPVRPGEEEKKQNSRSRSAKMRAIKL